MMGDSPAGNGDVTTIGKAAPQLRSFYAWLRAEESVLGRTLRRSDLSLDKVFPWAANLKIIEHESQLRGYRVRLFGTELVNIYGQDLTGALLDEALPESAKDELLAAYRLTTPGAMTYERIGFAWPDKRTVAYERLIYPLLEPDDRRKFAVVGYRILGDRGFLVAPSQTVRVTKEISRMLAAE